jgi:hypothetical protein
MVYTRHKILAYITYCMSTYEYADTQSFFCNKQAQSSGDHVQGDAAEISFLRIKWKSNTQMKSKVCTCQQVMQVNTYIVI